MHARHVEPSCAWRALGEGFEGISADELAQLAEGAGLDLADAFACQAKDLADILKRARRTTVGAEVRLDDGALAL